MKIIESDFEYRGYRCVTTFTDMGHRCGYVGVPKEHPLYGKHSNNQVKVTLKELSEDIKLSEIGNRGMWTISFHTPKSEDDLVDIAFYFKVHGGINYADGGNGHPVESDLWWFGFDCGHAGDCPDYDMQEKTWGKDNKMVKYRTIERKLYKDAVVRTLEYTQQECRNFVDQIINLVEKYYKDERS